MATFLVEGQLTNATDHEIQLTDRLHFNGATFGTNILVGQYQDSTHVSDGSDVHECTTNHVHNTKFLTGTTVSVDGGASEAVSAVTTAECPLKINFSDAASVETQDAKFYFYDGTTDATPMAGVTVQAFEQGQSAWTACNGDGNALALADNTTPATSHDFLIAVSISPTATGNKTGSCKILLTYV